MFLSGFLILSAGVGIASMVDWKKVKKIAHSRKNQMTSNQGEHELLIDLKDEEDASSPSNMAPVRADDDAKDSDRTEQAMVKTRLALSSGTMGLAVISQFGRFTAPWLLPLNIVLIGFFSAHIFKSAIHAILKEKRIRVDILDAVVISLCVLFRQISVAAFMVWILHLADFLLEKTHRKSRKYITEIFGQQTRHAWLLVNNIEVRTAVKDLKKDDIIVVNTGEQVPVDGIVIEHEAMIDQQSLTGEATPVEKKKGDLVFATTVLVAGKIHLKVRETGEKTLASRIIQIINDASTHKVRLQSVGEKMADKMVVPTLGLGALGYLTTGSGALLAIINADFGTGIRVAAPIALLASLGVAAKNGILIKDSKVFEMLPSIDVILFDKTGTLTQEAPIVSAIIPANQRYAKNEILFYTATAEQKFSHPLAKAILQKAEEENLVLPERDDSLYHVGLGIEVAFKGMTVKVGSSRYIEQQKIPIPATIQSALKLSRAAGKTAILTAVDDQLAGMIELQSSLREEAASMISYLKAERKISEVVLISGDHEGPTKEISNQLGIDRYFAGVLPHEKADYVKMLQAEGKKVMMVGDGINDSAALSYADISVSLKGASTIAVDVADIVFMDGSLKKFNYLFEVTDMLNQNVRKSFGMIVIPNSVCILGALAGVFGLSASLVLNNGFNLIAAINGMSPYLDKADKGSHKK